MAEIASASGHLCGAVVRSPGIHPGGFALSLVVTGTEPVGAPLPDVSADVVETEAVRLIRVDRCGAWIAVGFGVARGELSLPRIAPMYPSRVELVSPGEVLPLDPAPGCIFPLRLGR
jgi:hypothetical protein